MLHLDDAVAEYVPEFGSQRQATAIDDPPGPHATAPASRRCASAPLDLDLLADWRRIVEVLCNAKPDLGAGATAVVPRAHRRLRHRRGRPARDRRRHPDVLAATRSSTRSASRRSTTASTRRASTTSPRTPTTGLPSLPPQTWLIARALGVGLDEATTISNDPALPHGRRALRKHRRHRGRGVAILRAARPRRDARRRSNLRASHDPPRGRRAVVARGRLVLRACRFAMERASCSARRSSASMAWRSARASGHVGFTNVVGWADPDRDISVGFMTSGKPFITPGQVLWLSALYAIARHTTGRSMARAAGRDSHEARPRDVLVGGPRHDRRRRGEELLRAALRLDLRRRALRDRQARRARRRGDHDAERDPTATRRAAALDLLLHRERRRRDGREGTRRGREDHRAAAGRDGTPDAWRRSTIPRTRGSSPGSRRSESARRAA